MDRPTVLLTWHGRFAPGDSGSLLPLDFDVPPETGALALRFRYTPNGSRDQDRNAAAVRDCAARYLRESVFDGPGAVDALVASRGLDRNVRWIRNLFNVLLHDPSGRSVGRWDLGMRDDPPTVWIGPDFASPGFAAHAPAPGRWTAAVEVWEVFTDAAEAWLEVTAWPALPPEARMPAARPRRIAAGRPRKVARVRAPDVLFGEMHSHTVHSDGVWTVVRQAERAQAMGLDFVALTDHNVTAGHAEAVAPAPITRIRGIELTTFFGHFCLYGIDRHVPWYDRERGIRITEAIDAARAGGALASLAHPNNFGAPVCVGCRFQEGTVPYDRFDLLEVWYGAWAQRRTEIVKTLALWDRMWDDGLRPIAIAARDWHGPGQEDTAEVTFPVTAVQTTDNSEAGILGAIRAGRAFLTRGPSLELAVRTQAGAGGIGDTVSLGADGTAEIRLRIRRPNAAPAVACLVHDGRAAGIWTLPRRLDASHEWTVRAPGRWRVELWAQDGELLALSNHVLLRRGRE